MGPKISMTEVPRGAKIEKREVVRKINIYYGKYRVVNVEKTPYILKSSKYS